MFQVVELNLYNLRTFPAVYCISRQLPLEGIYIYWSSEFTNYSFSACRGLGQQYIPMKVKFGMEEYIMGSVSHSMLNLAQIGKSCRFLAVFCLHVYRSS